MTGEDDLCCSSDCQRSDRGERLVRDVAGEGVDVLGEGDDGQRSDRGDGKGNKEGPGVRGGAEKRPEYLKVLLKPTGNWFNKSGAAGNTAKSRVNVSLVFKGSYQ